MRSTAAILIHTPLSRRLLVFTLAFAFVLGFYLVFVIGWGGAATLLAQIFGEYKSILGKIGGVIVILFGLSTLGIVKIPWLYYDTRPPMARPVQIRTARLWADRSVLRGRFRRHLHAVQIASAVTL